MEETGVVPQPNPKLLGIFKNQRYTNRDQVAVYEFENNPEERLDMFPNLEIQHRKYFPLQALPRDIDKQSLQWIRVAYPDAEVG